MKNTFLPFSLPEISEDEISEVVQTLRSNWITTGPKVRQFEQEFAQYLGGCVEAIAVNSATSGLHLGLEAMGIGPGDEVITTTHTFTATAEIIRYLGANPVFVDIEKSSLCIDIDKIECAITKRTKAIIPVHFAGKSANMTEIIKIAKKHNLKILEDAAHALPTSHRGEKIGNLESDATVFSFYANKTITTGEGGMLVTRNTDIAKRAKIMRLHGISRDAFDRFTSDVPSWYYEVVAPGFKYNMTDISASIGIHQLKKIDFFQKKREKLATLYDKLLDGCPIIRPPHAENGDIHSWHLYLIQLNDSVKITRDEFIKLLFNRGIGCSVHYIPLHLHPFWRDTYGLSPLMFPNSQYVYEKSISLPIYSRMEEKDVHRVAKEVINLLT